MDPVIQRAISNFYDKHYSEVFTSKPDVVPVEVPLMITFAPGSGQ